MSVFAGSGVAIVTPFQNGAVDFTAFTRLLELQIASGTDAIVCCTATGEASTLSTDEKLSIIQFVVERVNGRVPVIAGTGGSNTATVIEQSKSAEAIGVDGLVIVTPYYNQTTQDGLVAHYNAVADAVVDTPILIDHAPERTGLSVTSAAVARMLKHPNIAGVVESGGSLDEIVTLASLCPDCEIYCGNDSQALPILSIGAKGVVSTIANILPDAMHALCESFFKGDWSRARAIQLELIPLWKAVFCEVSPIPIKAMMGMMRLCEPDVRPPLVVPTREDRRLIEEALRGYRLI